VCVPLRIDRRGPERLVVDHVLHVSLIIGMIASLLLAALKIKPEEDNAKPLPTWYDRHYRDQVAGSMPERRIPTRSRSQCAIHTN
jgi:hypothetical protein